MENRDNKKTKLYWESAVKINQTDFLLNYISDYNITLTNMKNLAIWFFKNTNWWSL